MSQANSKGLGNGCKQERCMKGLSEGPVIGPFSSVSIRKMAERVGFESANRRNFNEMQSSGRQF